MERELTVTQAEIDACLASLEPDEDERKLRAELRVFRLHALVMMVCSALIVAAYFTRGLWVGKWGL